MRRDVEDPHHHAPARAPPSREAAAPGHPRILCRTVGLHLVRPSRQVFDAGDGRGEVGPARVRDAGEVRLHGQPGGRRRGAGGGGGRGDVADQVVVGDRQHAGRQRDQLRRGLEDGERRSGWLELRARRAGGAVPPLVRVVLRHLHRLGDGRERRLVGCGGGQARVPLRVGRGHDSPTRSACSSSVVNRPTIATSGRTGRPRPRRWRRRRGRACARPAGRGTRRATVVELVRGRSPRLRGRPATSAPSGAREGGARPGGRQPRSELTTASLSAAARSPTDRTRSCSRPARARPRSTPGRQPVEVGASTTGCRGGRRGWRWWSRSARPCWLTSTTSSASGCRRALLTYASRRVVFCWSQALARPPARRPPRGGRAPLAGGRPAARPRRARSGRAGAAPGPVGPAGDGPLSVAGPVAVEPEVDPAGGVGHPGRCRSPLRSPPAGPNASVSTSRCSSSRGRGRLPWRAARHARAPRRNPR